MIILEDDMLLNKALCKAFANAGYEVAGAASSREAKCELEQGAALLVIDVGLPDGDGFALCKRVRERGNIGFQSGVSEILSGLNSKNIFSLLFPFS